MNTLFEKLDRLSSPLGSLLDAALNHLAPHATASACTGHICGVVCSGACGPCCGHQVKWLVIATSGTNCSRTTRCPDGCGCF